MSLLINIARETILVYSQRGQHSEIPIGTVAIVRGALRNCG